ncbi:TPA: hypothetical protein I9738_001039 [Serratia marcescens]|uniref:hypothetical protein n=1 Tax=Serratia sp. CY29653 TaxID=3383594 RepID=UPI001A27517B|nr:hypothetical protein [Serratia marcescens]HAT4973119.1 hypothetical protein [Serratia marcescens]HAT4987313.1 hypothetical protein [Serratia marcescens]HAT5047123.1 hypothetical protein [Serratia marcescens]HEJ7078217.1 hypothetical protein [Serratia marcescens]
MAKRKSNRAARWLLGMKAKASNRRKVCNYCRFDMWDDSGSWVIVGTEPVKSSARQKRKAKEIATYRAWRAEAQEKAL